jgi:DNA-binding protein Fis
MIFSGGYTIQVKDLPWAQATAAPPGCREESFRQFVRSYLDSAGSDHPCAELLETIERLLIDEALRRCQGNQTHAAQLLGLARPTLHAKLQKYGLHGRDE